MKNDESTVRYYKSPEHDVYIFHQLADVPKAFIEITEDEAIRGVTRTPDEVLAEKLAELARLTDQLFNPIWNQYSQAEIQSWVSQEAEAGAWLADNRSPTPTIDALNPTETKDAYCRIILNKAAQFKSGMVVVGCSIRVRDAIKAMTADERKSAVPAQLLNAALLESQQ